MFQVSWWCIAVGSVLGSVGYDDFESVVLLWTDSEEDGKGRTKVGRLYIWVLENSLVIQFDRVTQMNQLHSCKAAGLKFRLSRWLDKFWNVRIMIRQCVKRSLAWAYGFFYIKWMRTRKVGRALWGTKMMRLLHRWHEKQWCSISCLRYAHVPYVSMQRWGGSDGVTLLIGLPLETNETFRPTSPRQRCIESHFSQQDNMTAYYGVGHVDESLKACCFCAGTSGWTVPSWQGHNVKETKKVP